MSTTVASAEPSAPPEQDSVEDSRPQAFRMPHGLTSTRFGLLIGAVLVAGLVALLAVNTSLAAGAIQLGGLESALARTSEQQQALDLTVDDLSSPQSLQAQAIALGMVPASAPAFLDTATGQLSGQLLPAKPGSAPGTGAPMVTVPEPTPPPSDPSAPGTATSRVEPPATLVMPPDPGVDGASVTRSVQPTPAVEGLPPAAGAAQDGEPVPGDQPATGGQADDAAAIVDGAP